MKISPKLTNICSKNLNIYLKQVFICQNIFKIFWLCLAQIFKGYFLTKKSNFLWFCLKYLACKWKRISHKQSARWQNLSRLKASALFFLQKILVSHMKRNNLYLGLVCHLVDDGALLEQLQQNFIKMAGNFNITA